MLLKSRIRDPYPGVIAEGALADAIVLDGNPLENMGRAANTDTNFVFIMKKDGNICKNTIDQLNLPKGVQVREFLGCLGFVFPVLVSLSKNPIPGIPTCVASRIDQPFVL